MRCKPSGHHRHTRPPHLLAYAQHQKKVSRAPKPCFSSAVTPPPPFEPLPEPEGIGP